jgi:hypothetical protein
MWQKKILWRLPNKNGGQDGDPGPKEVSTTMIRKMMPAPNPEANPRSELHRNTDQRMRKAHVC